MKIIDCILEKMTPRLRERRLLVVYDPFGRMKLVAELLAKNQNARFIDTTTHILDALKTTHEAIRSGLKQSLVIYAPYEAPQNNNARVADLFSAVAEIGHYFPQVPADEYLQICLQALPKKEAAVRDLFASSDPNKGPDFELVEPLFDSSSVRWPMLRGLSKKTSEAELLHWLLTATNENYEKASSEIVGFADSMLRVKLTDSDKTNADLLRSKLWMAALMTEFMAVRGQDVPEEFASVSVAPLATRDIVLDVVEKLRNDRTRQTTYEKQAHNVATVLGIAKHLTNLKASQTRCTFEEEVLQLQKNVIEHLRHNQLEEISPILTVLGSSVWMQNSKGFLTFTEVAKDFCRSLQEFDANKTSVSLKTLIENYCAGGAVVDTLARSFVSLCDTLPDECAAFHTDPSIDESLQSLRSRLLDQYRLVKQQEHTRFVSAIANEGWPVVDIPNNASVFRNNIEPLLRNGVRVAVIIVDALRFEVGLGLVQNLEGLGAKIKPACAALPTISEVGKATLLPDGPNLEVVVDYKIETITPQISGNELKTADDRMKILANHYGDRFKHMLSRDFLKKKPSVFEKVDLLCLRYDDIDQTLETENSAMLDAIPSGIAHLGKVVRRLQEIEIFSDVIIVTDHGFGLNLNVAPGDRCDKPDGMWVGTHDRFLLGEGTEDENNYVFRAEQLGIRTNAKQATFPRALCAYRAGRRYFHGGLSLAEAVVPIIEIHLGGTAITAYKTAPLPDMLLVPKKPKFTTQILRLTLRVTNRDLLGNDEAEHAVRIEVTKKGSKESAGIVRNNDSGILFVSDDDVDFSIKLYDFNEPCCTFEVRAVDPETGKELAKAKCEVEITQ